MVNLFEENSVILFQGDSITDCGRNRENPDNLGDGYVKLITGMLSDRYSQYNIRCINRGISGDKIRDLSLRWDIDCIDIKPDLLSILIGVNDTLITPAGQFEEEYRLLLQRTTIALNSKIILCEPCSLHPPEYWAPDGVHPTPAGHALIAKSWIEYVDETLS